MWFSILILGAVIGANNFATALALGSLGQEARRGRILMVFALFEFTVPLVGIWLGQRMSEMVAGHAHWLGPALLAGLGVWTIFEATRDTRSQEKLARWLTSWRGLLILSAGLSLDNLVVGFGLGLGGFDPLTLASVIMFCSVAFAWIGLEIGGKARRNYETISEFVAGVLLIAVAAADWADLL